MKLEGKRILVTGASGALGGGLAMDLARRNTVYGVARFNNLGAVDELRAAGVDPIKKDVGTDSLEDLPNDIDYIFHFAGVLTWDAERDRGYTMAVNSYSLGRMMRRYPKIKGFIQASSGAIYKFQQRAIREADPLGAEDGTYSISKIAAEAVGAFASEQWGIPTVFLRIFQTYGPRGGPTTRRVRMVAEGKEIPVYPNDPNPSCPLYITDFVRLAENSVTHCTVPPTAVNMGGTELVSFKEYLDMAGRYLGVEPKILPSLTAHRAIYPDTTLMVQLLGKPQVSVDEGIRLVVEENFPERVVKE